MTRIAQLSDLHLVEEGVGERRGVARARVRYLSFWRPIDPAARIASVRRTLAAAAGCDHLVITGDLTEDGLLPQFELLRGLLEESGIPPERITLVPGNHDAYGDGWDRAIAGPLAPWAGTSRRGAITVLDDVTIAAVSSAVPQTFLKSSGHVGADQLEAVATVAARDRRRPVVIAQHHPPFRVANHWVHGLLDHRDVRSLLEARPNVSLVHGHTHAHRDGVLAGETEPRVFSALAVTERDDALRMYVVGEGNGGPAGLVPMATPHAAAA